ncbi:hypothetical protein N7520_003627 [Penicillium odoratum]|uniref:uncharacterized protein n=1 Tax=Penicillium odoratum TaxID=1167516 RepID=UPI002548425B|nr:uncharacterized protein N7520_003627 [Penicillium odoratum]KAJ5769068.1 hypothetical protein N7520_003627 [Penicillium odoratum]
MKFNYLITYLVLHLSFVAGNPVDLSGMAVVEARGLVPRTLSITGTTSGYCWAVSSGTLVNPGYAAGLLDLYNQMFNFFNVVGNVGADEFIFTSSINLGVIWKAKVIVIATTESFWIADAVNDLYGSLNLGDQLSLRGGTAAVASVASAHVGTLIEMVSMINGRSTYNTLKRDVDEKDLSKRASCGAGTEDYSSCCTIEID